MNIRQITLPILLAVSAPLLSATPVSATTGTLTLDIGLGESLVFAPLTVPNVVIEGPFNTANIGTPFSAELLSLGLQSPALLLQTGTYLINLEQTTPTPGTVTLVTADTFNAVFSTRLPIAFDHIGPGTVDNSGDIMGEFGEPQPIRTTLLITGNYTSGPSGFELSNVEAVQVIPEPSSLFLLPSAVLALLLAKRRVTPAQ